MANFTKGTQRIEKVSSKEYSLDREIENIRGYAIYSDKSKYYIAGVRTLADARLIVAAPDLLQIAWAFLHCLYSVHDCLPDEFKDNNQEKINIVTALLKRIYGKEGGEA